MRIYGRRLRAGGTTVPALAANFGFIALYNDSTIGHILRVDYWTTLTQAGTDSVAFFTSGTVGSLVAQGITVFSGEGTMAGQIWSGTNTTAPPFGVILDFLNTTVTSSRDMPWFYIRPGFSLVVKADVVNVFIGVSLWWEDLEMSMLSPHELE